MYIALEKNDTHKYSTAVDAFDENLKEVKRHLLSNFDVNPTSILKVHVKEKSF